MLARSLFALALLVNASGALSETLPSSDDKKRLERFEAERFEKEVDDFRNRLKIPGLSAVIVKDQKVLWAKGFGFADLENRIPATPDTLYSIASVTKTFAATLVMQLVEQGKLDSTSRSPITRAISRTIRSGSSTFSAIPRRERPENASSTTATASTT